MAAGNIRVDIDKLTGALAALKLIQVTLDTEASNITGVNSQIDQAITGTASSIATFDQQFQGWATNLKNVAAEMDQAVTILSNALTDAHILAGSL